MSKKGRKAFAICDRSGFKYPYSEMVREPGTGYIVHRSESDGKYNLVDHPQNYSPRPKKEGEALPLARPDTYTGDEFVLIESTGLPLVMEQGGYPVYNESD